MSVSIEIVYGNEYHKQEKIKAIKKAARRIEQERQGEDGDCCEEVTRAADQMLRDICCQGAALV